MKFNEYVQAGAVGLWSGLTWLIASLGSAIAAAAVAVWGAVGWIAVGIGTAIAVAAVAIWKAVAWCFEGVRPLRFVAFLCIMLLGLAMVYINARGAYLRTGDYGYTAVIIGIEGLVLVALPIIFAVRGWFNTPVAILIFISGITIASFNAKPALEDILSRGEGVVNPAERIAQAEDLEDEVFGFRNPETGERMTETGMLAQVLRQENDASRNRTELGHTTASREIDAEAAERRKEINQKLQLAETYRAEAQSSTWVSQLSMITYIVAELIRSFGLKVLVGFGVAGGNPSGREAKDPKRVEAGKKAAETARANKEAKKQIEGTEYWRQRILKAINTRMKNPSAQGMRDTYFDGGAQTVAELETRLKYYLRKGFLLDPKTGETLTQDHVDFILRQGDYAPPPPALNGHDHSTEDNRDVDDDGAADLPAHS